LGGRNDKGPAFLCRAFVVGVDGRVQKEDLAPNSPVKERGTTVLLGLMKPSGWRKLVAAA
jgi:hypothetical protein